MENENKLPNRKSVRLKNYDYSSDGLYFITICTQDMKCLFGYIKDGEMILNKYGKSIEQELLKIPTNYPDTTIVTYIVMPNHIHFILHSCRVYGPDGLRVYNSVGAGSARPQTGSVRQENKIHTIGQIIGRFKFNTTKTINMENKLWQRGFYEHIIRSEKSFIEIDYYIRVNPKTWESDKLFRVG